MPDDRYPNPHEEDIMAGDRRLSRPDSSLPDWEVPDTSYRPIPIVWFTGAMLVQFASLTCVFWLFLGQAGAITVALSALITGVIGSWTWERGMKNAAGGWKIATVLVLAAQLALVCGVTVLRS